MLCTINKNVSTCLLCENRRSNVPKKPFSSPKIPVHLLSKSKKKVETSKEREGSSTSIKRLKSQIEKILQKGPNLVRDEDSNGDRMYKIEGSNFVVPSVTTVIKKVQFEGLKEWQIRVTLEALMENISQLSVNSLVRVREAMQILVTNALEQPTVELQRAADFGDKVHLMLDNMILGKDVSTKDLEDDVKSIVDAYNKWKSQSGVTVIRGETFVYSKQYGYAGAADAIGVNKDGKLVVIDWKTTKMVSPKHAIQVAAYARALSEMTSLPVEEGYVVRLSNNIPVYQEKQVKDIKYCFEVFQSCLSIWKFTKNKELFNDLNDLDNNKYLFR